MKLSKHKMRPVTTFMRQHDDIYVSILIWTRVFILNIFLVRSVGWFHWHTALRSPHLEYLPIFSHCHGPRGCRSIPWPQRENISKELWTSYQFLLPCDAKCWLLMKNKMQPGCQRESREAKNILQMVPMHFLAHLPLDKIAAISQTTFSNAFSWMKSFVFWFEFHWSLILILTISQYWFR